MRYVIIFLFLLLSLTWSDETELNLPERFVSVVSSKWTTRNGNKVKQSSGDEETIQKQTLYYDNGNIQIKGHVRFHASTYGRSLDEHVPATSDIYSEAKGTLVNGQASGKTVITVDGEWLRGKFIGRFNGKIEDGKLHIVSTGLKVLYYDIKVLHTKHGSGSSKYGRWKSDMTHASAKGFVYHSIFKLPINQPQSSQTFINNTPNEEPEPIADPQPATPAFTGNIEASAGIQTEEKPKKTLSMCQDPDFKNDKEIQQYCANKAYNAKLDIQKEAEERDREAEEARAEVEYEAELKKQKEEDAYWKKKNEAYFANQRKEALKRAKEAEAKQNKAFHENIAKEQNRRKAVQAEIKKAHEIVERFGKGDLKSQYLSHKKIEQLKDYKDVEKAIKIKEAMRKQYYDSKQAKLQGEAEYQAAKAKELDKKAKYVQTLKDTSLSANKLLAKIDPTGLGDKIVEIQEEVYSSIDTIDKKGWDAAGDVLLSTNKILSKFDPTGKTKKILDLQEKVTDNINTFNKSGIKGIALKHADGYTYGLASVASKTKEDYHKFYTEGLTLGKDEVYYDDSGKRLKKVKAGTRVYDQNGKEVSFSFGKRVGKDMIALAHKNVKEYSKSYKDLSGGASAAMDLQEGYNKGDLGKMIGAGIELKGSKKTVEDAADKVLKKTGVK